MTDSDSGMDFNFNQIMKSIQAIEIKNIQATQELNTMTSNLEEINKEVATAREKCEDEEFKSSQYNKEIALLEEKKPRLIAAIDALTKQIEDNQVQIEDIKWRQTKAKLVLESERAHRQTYRAMMDKRIAEDAAPKTESELEGKSASQVSAAVAERALKKEELGKRKEFLEKEMSKMKNILEETEKSIADVGSEASVLKKRNSAVLLRLRRKLQVSEDRRRGLEERQEMAKRGRPPF